MPADFCHPTAPHRKLKLPEWYVSNLMLDRALDAIVRRVKKFDRKHDIPYLAGYSLDGKTIYIDRHLPRSFEYKGRAIAVDRYLLLHEEVEKTLDRDHFMTAEEAQKWGIVDAVISKRRDDEISDASAADRRALTD